MHDLARAAGVSLATVDRVLNRRPGVRDATIEKVERAIAEIGFERDVSASMLARARDVSIRVLMPDGENRFMANLAAALAALADARRRDRLDIGIERIRALDSSAFAEAIGALRPETCDCAILVAADAANVREAVAEAAGRGVAVITLVSDLPGSARRHFVGIDNIAAGRTAAALLGRFCGGEGRIGMVVGSLALRDHGQRCEGFSERMASLFPGITLVGPVEGNDRSRDTEEVTQRLLAEEPDLVGLYSMGAGNSGLIAALRKSGRAGNLRLVAHELTDATRDALLDGTLDVVLDQNPEAEAATAVELARMIALRAEPVGPAPMELGISLAENLR